MPRKTREPKYKCQYCKRPLDNPTTKTSHELACPENPKNIKIETNQPAIIPKTKSKPQGGKKTSPGKQPIRKELELEKDDQLLRQYPTIDKLVKDVEALKVIPQAIQANQVQIAQLGDTIGKLNVLMAGIANRMSNPSETQRGNPEKVQPPQGNNQADEALQASLAADKEKTGYTPEEKGTDSGGKMEKLRKETEEKEVAGSGQAGQVETGGVDPSLAALANPNMPEGLQKLITYLMVAEKALPLINSLRGVQPQPAQAPEDLKAFEKVFVNAQSFFNLALKMTDTVNREAEKRAYQRIEENFTLTPKLPGIKTDEEEGLK